MCELSRHRGEPGLEAARLVCQLGPTLEPHARDLLGQIVGTVTVSCEREREPLHPAEVRD